MNIIKNLPDEIIRYIIPFTYETQNKELLNAIRKQYLIPRIMYRKTLGKGIRCYTYKAFDESGYFGEVIYNIY